MSWDERFLKLADHVAGWSKDPSTKVGAIITRGNFVVSVGYNGFPAGIADDDRLDDRDTKHKYVIHAEENAIMSARQDLMDCTLYVSPLHPCTRCAAKIIQSRITRVVAKRPSQIHAERYELDTVQALFQEAGIELVLKL